MIDSETSISHYWSERKLHLIQFGNEQDEWVVRWTLLSEEQQEIIRIVLFDSGVLKVLHNAYFDLVVFRFAGIVMRNVYCTMVTEMILNCGKLNREEEEDEDVEGAENGFYSLAALAERRLFVRLDKTEQTSDWSGELSAQQIEYAARDVRHLLAIRRAQLLDLHTWDLEFTAALDMAALPALAEMTYVGMPLDHDAWRANIELAWPVVEQAKQDLENAVLADPLLKAKAIAMGVYKEQDSLNINFRSTTQARRIWGLLLPDMPGTSKAILRGYMKRVYIEDASLRTAVQMYEAGEEEVVKEYLYNNHRDFLIENDMLVPAGSFTINWGSTQQVLELFQAVDKKLKSLNKESMAKFGHVIGEYRKEYTDALKLLSTYGEKFIQNHVEPDGVVRTTFNPIVSTGRLSSRKPNMQNIPSKDHLKNRYRNAFIAEPGFVYVDSDYSSQELVVIAEISGDPVWREALKNQQDLHSVCADLLHKAKWKQAAMENCDYYRMDWFKDHHWLTEQQYEAQGRPAGWVRKQRKDKCSCKLHKPLRSGTKTLDFGLAYGMSKFKLSASMKISVPEAQSLQDDYFREFPLIGRALRALGQFGVERGYIQTLAPFFRKRWFPYWRFARNGIDAHIRGVQYDATLGSIERASKNMPIQGTSADMTKVALWLIFEYIHLNNLSDKVKLCLQVHDQVVTRAEEAYSATWKPIMHDLMLQAGKFSIPSGLLGAETNITPVWSK